MCRVVMHYFGLVQAHRTSSNLLKPHHHRHIRCEFGVVQLYRTFSNYIFTGETRCAGCLCTSLRWFKRIEPFFNFLEPHHYRQYTCILCIVPLHEFGVFRLHQTSNLFTRWYNMCIEPFQTTSLQT